MKKTTSTSNRHRNTPVIWILGLVALLTIAPPSAAQEPEEAMRFLNLMHNYIGLSNEWVDTVSETDKAIYLAIEGIIEIYEERGEKAKAVPHLERILQKHRDRPAVRTIVRFKLRDLYRETGRADQALEQLELVIQENSK